MKFKVIENEMPHFEEQLNDFALQKNIEIVDVKYTTSVLPPDEKAGWNACNMHSALIRYIEFEN